MYCTCITRVNDLMVDNYPSYWLYITLVNLVIMVDCKSMCKKHDSWGAPSCKDFVPVLSGSGSIRGTGG